MHGCEYFNLLPPAARAASKSFFISSFLEILIFAFRRKSASASSYSFMVIKEMSKLFQI